MRKSLLFATLGLAVFSLLLPLATAKAPNSCQQECILIYDALKKGCETLKPDKSQHYDRCMEHANAFAGSCMQKCDELSKTK